MEFKIGDKYIGGNHPCFIIAEMSANHLHDLDKAMEMVRVAKEIGADAIKIQTYTADTITLDSDKEYFKITQGTIWDGVTLYNLYKEAYTPWEWQPKIKEYAESLDLICFSSPFDFTAVDFLEEMDVPAYKIASFEITDIPLIEYVASKDKPIIISTGIAELADIEEAIKACHRVGNSKIALLKCTSAYPAPLHMANVSTIPNLRQTFGTVAGLSDHTLGNAVAAGAVGFGAKIVEKHLILDRSEGGPDSAFSMEPEEFKEMVDLIRGIEQAIGNVTYELTDKQIKSREHSRSLFIVQDVKAGDTISEENIRSIRPGFGLHPKHYKDVLGKKFTRDMEKGTPLEWGGIAIE